MTPRTWRAELPLCGLVSEQPAQNIAASFIAFREAADEITEFVEPLLAFRSVTGASLACNPGPHLTDVGLTDGSTETIFTDSIIALEPNTPVA